MRLLADECFDARLTAALRAAGHDIERVPTGSGLDDLGVAALAEQGNRALLTQDKDFGAIALEHGRPREGVVIVRASLRDPASLTTRLVRLLGRLDHGLGGQLIVIDDQRVRARPLVVAGKAD